LARSWVRIPAVALNMALSILFFTSSVSDIRTDLF
jgi:hypothetical protein